MRTGVPGAMSRPLAFGAPIGYHGTVKLVTAEQMRELDRRAIQDAGIPGAVLMENAGRAVVSVLQERYGGVHRRHVTVFCGTGNNGGDGFVIARLLRLAGANVQLIVAGDPGRIQGDALTHFRLLDAVGVRPCSGPPSDGICVDALLGTGSKGAPRGDHAQAIRWMNAGPGPRVAVDVPSGVDSDSGATPGEAVRADLTVTFGYPKVGLFLPPGADRVGELVVSNIGFPWDSLSCLTPYAWMRAEDLCELVRPRARDAHKGMYGHVLVVGGSRGMSGAPTMAAMAALRAGSGLVTVAAPSSAQWLIAAKSAEVMTVPVSEVDGALCAGSFEQIQRAAESCDVLCVGPGGARLPEAQALLARVASEIDRPMVIDADGLNAIAGVPGQVAERSTATILTPHPGECGRLLGMETEDVQVDRIRAVRRAAERYRAVVVLKGARTLIADGRAGRDFVPVAVNTTGNPGMATGGSGDSLTGIIGSLVGQGLGDFDAACLGVFLHGRAGDLAAAGIGESGMIAGDIIGMLPGAMRELEGSR